MGRYEWLLRDLIRFPWHLSTIFTRTTSQSSVKERVWNTFSLAPFPLLAKWGPCANQLIRKSAPLGAYWPFSAFQRCRTILLWKEKSFNLGGLVFLLQDFHDTSWVPCGLRLNPDYKESHSVLTQASLVQWSLQRQPRLSMMVRPERDFLGYSPTTSAIH